MTSDYSEIRLEPALPLEEDLCVGKQVRGRSKWHQNVAAILGNLASLCTGVAMAWTAPALPLIQRETNVTLPLYATREEASWISSLVPIGALLAALPAGLLADHLGRRTVLLSTAVVFLVGWIIVISADHWLELVLLGRLIIGLGVGVSNVLVPLYCEEIAEDSIRGAVGAYLDLMLCVGFLYMYLFGAFLPYVWFTAIAAATPILFGITFFWMPETPTYLVSKQRIEDARKSLQWLRNSEDSNLIGGELECLTVRSNHKQQTSRFNRTTLKGVAIIFGLMFFEQMSGINAVIFYTEQIFRDAGSSLPAYLCTIIIGVVQVFAVITSSLTVDHLGRRPLLLMSASVMSVCLASLSTYSYFREQNFDVESWRWIPLGSLVIFVTAFSVGFGPLPWFMMVELIPTSAKCWVCAISISFNWISALLVTKLFPFMLYSVGQDVTYGLLCVMCILAVFFVAFFVPETKGKSIEEIQVILGKKS